MIEYKTILNFANDEFVEKRSKFIGYAKPIMSADEAMSFVSEIKLKHRDATHNVFAYVVREGNGERCSDDGEPQGTAGIPTLDVIKKEGITDCVVVVTRYFGGTMLGAGGLVRAYSHASKLALTASGIITMSECAVCKVSCDYNFYGKLNTYLTDINSIDLNSSFGENVTVNFSVPLSDFYETNAKIVDISNGELSIELVKKEFKQSKK